MKYLLSILLLTATNAFAQDGQYIYAAQRDGTIHVYDINANHQLVQTLRYTTSTSVDLRGIAAAVPTHLIYVFHVINKVGYIAVLDLLSGNLLATWQGYSPEVDRGDVTPDGQTLYVPSGWDAYTHYESVVDALTGALITKITMPVKTHDTIVTLDGKTVFMQNRGPDRRIRTVSTASNQVIATTAQFAGTNQPFSITSDNNFLIADATGIYGFQYVNLSDGIIHTALFSGTTLTGNLWPHGIGMNPSETEAWVCDRGRGNHFVHVFDISSLPPTQTHLITVSNDNPHWVTFTIDGRFAYVAAYKDSGRNTDIIDTTTYNRIGQIGPSEELLEIDFSNGVVTAVGKQFGIGRL